MLFGRVQLQARRTLDPDDGNGGIEERFDEFDEFESVVMLFFLRHGNDMLCLAKTYFRKVGGNSMVHGMG